MLIWRQAVTEFRTLLAQLPIFGDISEVELSSDDPAVTLELDVNAGRRSLVLLLSDCVGRAWTEGRLLRSLEPITRRCPLVIVQMLPQRLWAGCGLSFVPVQVGLRDDDGTSTLWARGRTGCTAVNGDGEPIPVLELDARWLRPWASLVSGTEESPIRGMAVYTGAAPEPFGEDEAMTALERVALFRSAASPMAVRLASCLAVAPLSLPLLRLVQHASLPESLLADLAEVFLGGLCRRVLEPADDAVDFEFYPGVRELLLSSLSRAEALRVFRLVTKIAGDRLGSSQEFADLIMQGPDARLTEPGPSLHGILTEPFASVALTVLRSIGGRYSDLADELIKPRTGDLGPAVLAAARAVSADSDSETGAPGSAVIAHSGIAYPEGETMPAPSNPAEPARPPRIWRNVPPNNPYFTGREDLLLALRAELRAGVTTALVPIALHGLGGVGKSQIAVEYTYRFQDDYDLVCWIPGEVIGQMRSELAALAPLLGVPDDGNQEVTLAGVREALRRGEPFSRWLLVIDKAEDPEEVLKYLPPTGGHRLITSRNQLWATYARTFPVPQFTREESISLIRSRGNDISYEDADRLADRLGDLPLALEHAAAYQAENGMSVDGYLTRLDEQMSTLLQDNPPRGYRLDIVAAWTLAFEDLERRAPEAAALVQLCSFLGPEPIPYTLLWAFRNAADLPADLKNMLLDERPFYRAIRQVGRYALLQVQPSSQTLTEHRLVQQVLRERLSEEQQAQMESLVCRLLAVANPGLPDDPRRWEMLSTINRHLRFTKILDYDSYDARRLIIDQIRYLFIRGDQRSSRKLAEEAVRRWRDSPGPDDQQTLTACRLLGIVLREMGRYREARDISEDTYQRSLQAFTERDERTLVTANSYAADLRTAGRYKEALDLDERIYRLHQEVFGEDDENTFRSAHNLAIDRRLNGFYQKALELNRETHKRRRELLGDQRWETWSSAGAAARDLRFLGEYAESARLLEEAVAACRVLLGPEHREVVRLRMDYAMTLRRLGRLDEARAEAQYCMEVNRRRLGEVHNYTLSAMTIYAEVLRLLGEVGQALDYAEQVRLAAPGCYGEGHALVATCEHNYAIKLRAIGDVESAFAIDRTINAQFHGIYRDQSRRTTNSDISLALDFALRGDRARARPLLAEMRERSAQIRSEDHPRTQFIAVNLAKVLAELGQIEEAAELRATALDALRDRLGSRHPEVILAESNAFIEFEMEIPDR